jgi:hypothetical protein
MKTKIIVIVLVIIQGLNGFAQESKDSTEVKKRTFQISFVPGFGTSRGAKDEYTNIISLNVLGGYEHSLDGTEVGAFVNIDKYNVSGAQLAGFVNVVGGSVDGGQFSGFTNVVKGDVKGAQGSAFANVVAKDMTGIQGSGYVNVTAGDVRGAQLSGFVNVADSIRGAQLSGFVNTSTTGVRGAQLAGFVNVTGNGVKGAQISGFTNVASKDVDGAQISGFVNVAKNLKGTQIGIINIADSIERGAMIGLINIAKNGKKQIGIEHSDVIDFNLAFRSGTDRLYAVLFAGIDAKEDFNWTYGAGFGTQFKIKNKWNSNIELTTQTINSRDNHHEDVNLLNRLSWNVGIQLANHLTLSAGPALNVYVTNIFDQNTGLYGDDIYNNTFYNETFSDTNVKMWLGYNVSIRF